MADIKRWPANWFHLSDDTDDSETHFRYGAAMQRTRPKWRADHGSRARKSVDDIQASIKALEAKDLLDLLDIFNEVKNSLLREFAHAEASKRGLEL